jgi:hypothetical protein
MGHYKHHLRIKRLVETILLKGDPWRITDAGVRAVEKVLEASLSSLFEQLDGIEPRKNRRLAFKALDQLVSGVCLAIDTFHNVNSVATKQAHMAQAAKLRKAAQRYDQLFKCILAEAKAQNLKMSKGIKFAQVVRPGVRRRMGLEPDENGWPSPSTIKSAVAKLTGAARRGQHLKS